VAPRTVNERALFDDAGALVAALTDAACSRTVGAG
jgi:hypothetical protein